MTEGTRGSAGTNDILNAIWLQSALHRVQEDCCTWMGSRSPRTYSSNLYDRVNRSGLPLQSPSSWLQLRPITAERLNVPQGCAAAD